LPSFCALLSGGKDSNYALYRALREGWKARCVLVVRSAREDSWMFHTPLVSLAKLQVEAMGLESALVEASVSGVKEQEVEELANAIEKAWRDRKFNMLVVGALASRYQYERISRIAGRLGLHVYAPAWRYDPYDYMRMIVSEGLRFVISKISVMGLPSRLLGMPVEDTVLEEVLSRAERYGFHPAFEGGEAETLVYDAPHYRKRLCLKAKRKALSMYEHVLDVEEAWLGDKKSRCIWVDGELVA